MKGAKSKLTPERAEIIIDAIREGNTKETAAKLAGVHESTLYNWLARGRDEEAPELQDKTLKELRAMAKHYNITRAAKKSKPILIADINRAANIYRTFLEDMQQAEAQGMAEHVRNIKTAAAEDWRASAWYLERRDPTNWAKRDRLEVDNKHSGSIKTEHEEQHRIEVEHRLAQDKELQKLYMAIWERQQLANGSE